MVVVDLNLARVIATRFACRWWRMQPSESASPSAVNAFACLADAFAAVAPVLVVVEAIPLEEVSALIAVPPRRCRFYFPKIPHFIFIEEYLHRPGV